MELEFRQVEQVFAASYGIGRDREVAFRGRLQHLQRLRFPDGVNTGKGRKARYGWAQVIQLCVVLELIDIGVTPDVAVTLVRANTALLITVLGQFPDQFEDETAFSDAVRNQRCPWSKTYVVSTTAAALSGLRGDGSTRPPSLDIEGGLAFAERIQARESYDQASTFIDLGSRLCLVMSLISALASQKREAVVEDFASWLARFPIEELA